MSDESSYLRLARDRISRVMDVLSLAAIGAFDHEQCVIRIEGEDEFALLEQTLNQFTRELAEARQENELHVKELTISRRELEEKLRTIESQQQAIKRLSNPILEIWDRVLALPVIGTVDAERAADMTEALLVAVVRNRAQCVIIDATGAAAFETTTADYFQRMVKAAGLLGAYCVITGISPENAQSLSSLNVDFRGILTLSNLKQGLEACIRYQQRGLLGATHGHGANLPLRSENDSTGSDSGRARQRP
jgi:rsbT co-antagonist protein RsbR